MRIFKEQETKHVVYVVEVKKGIIKIGTTNNFKNRLKALEKNAGSKIENFFMVEGYFKTEKFFHDIFSNKRIYTELFKEDFLSAKKIFSENEFTEIIKEKEKSKVIEPTDKDIENFIQSITYYCDLLLKIEDLKVYNDTLLVKKQIIKGCEWLKDVDIEDYEETLEDIELLNEPMDFLNFISSSLGSFGGVYCLDVIFNKFIKSKITAIELLRLFISELEILRKKSGLITYAKPEIATWIEAWKDLEMTDKEIYAKIKEKLI